MKHKFLLFFIILLVSTVLSSVASADSSHVRIVRLSFVQGDVRFARQFHEDSITDTNAVWETAQLNLPIREGNAISTGNGRAEVEFENGAMAFLNANTVIEFFDLSLHDGSRVTRLILRQGSASFYQHSVNGDYLSVTGGDFSVEVTERATFRLANFDDGSTVVVQSGHLSVLQNDKSTPLEKGQSLTINTQDPGNQVIAKAPVNDDFDRWVAGRIQSEQVATNQLQPTATTYGNYVSGYSDLYTYGSWMNVDGFNCWRPFGVGLGWSPFSFGNWYMDGNMGWTFIGSAPWGWLPYHYGGWIFSPVYGWIWNPGGLLYGRPSPYHPVTAVFVHSGNTLGVVPMHPSDKSGKTPINLAHGGVYPVQSGALGKPLAVTSGEKWDVLKNSRAAALTSGIAPATAPARVTSTVASTGISGRETFSGRGSSIVYDSNEHRFVNSSQARVATATGAHATNELRAAGKDSANTPANRTAVASVGKVSSTHTSGVPSTPHSASLPPRPSVAPPPAHVGGGYGGSASSGSSSGGSSRSWSGPSSSSSSAPSSNSSSSSHPSGGSGGGGRPH